MASLVADYGTDSESDSDLEIPESAKAKFLLQEDLRCIESISGEATNNFFSAEDNGNNDTDTGSEDEQQDKEVEDTVPSNHLVKKLPNPMAKGHTSSTYIPTPCSFTMPENRRATESSVFSNQYQKAEEDKWSVLEQHVKMTTSDNLDKSTMKKKICMSFRKGKCRYGNKCSFSHSNEVVTIQKRQELYEDDEEGEESKKTAPQNKHSYYGMRANKQHLTKEKEDDDSYMANVKRKFRAGVTNNLRPPKKAMVALSKQRETERPWTTSN